MTEEAKRILDVLPELIRTDEGFRIRLYQVLNGEFSSKADLARVLEEIQKSRQEAAERFEAIDRRFEAIDRRFEALLVEVAALRQDSRSGMQDLKDWVHLVVGGFQVRAGRSLEDTVAGTLRIALQMKDVDVAKIRMRQKIVDIAGRAGPPGRTYEVDIVATNGETWVFEVKSVADEEDVERFNDKAELAITSLGLASARKALITLAKTPELAQACSALGIHLG